MTADPPRPPADFGPRHVAERATLRATPPPVERDGVVMLPYRDGDIAAIPDLATLPQCQAFTPGEIDDHRRWIESQLAAARKAGQADRAAREAAEQRLAELVNRQDAVGAFIAGHARRLATAAGYSWDDLDGDDQSTWMAEVHHVLNNLAVVGDDHDVIDGRNHGDERAARVINAIRGNVDGRKALATDLRMVTGTIRSVALLSGGHAEIVVGVVDMVDAALKRLIAEG